MKVVCEKINFCFFEKLTKKYSRPGATCIFQGNAGILQCPVDTLEELLLLRVHLFHFTVTDAKKLVIKLIEPEDVKRNGQVSRG